MFEQLVPHSLTLPDIFLLNPGHAGFLNGGKRRFGDFRSANAIGLMIVFFMFSIFGGAMSFLGGREVSARSQLGQSGVETAATVSALRQHTSTDSKGHNSTSYHLTYSFYAGQNNSDNPTPYTHEQQIYGETYRNLTQGSRIMVRYLANDPTVSRFLGDTQDNGNFALVLGASFLCGITITALFVFRKWRRNQQLIQNGQLIAGKIAEVIGKKGKNSYTITLRYDFRSPAGDAISKSESRLRDDLAKSELPQIGTPVAVIYVHDRLFRML